MSDAFALRGGDIAIMVEVGSKGIPEVTQELNKLNKTAKESQTVTKESTRTTKENVTASTSMGSQNRMLAWDFMLLGRSLGIVNREMGLNNRAVSAIAGLMQLLSSIMRIMIISEELYAMPVMKTNVTLAARASVGPIGNAINTVGATTAARAIGSVNPISEMANLALTAIGGFATGGNVLQSGPYMLHKGEQVVRPQDKTNYSNVNINMRTGAINSQVDVDKMLVDMASTMSLESRRRMG